MSRSIQWRVLFVLGALLGLYGGPQHPGGTMLEMLRDPIWLSAHAFVTAGFVAWVAGLWIWGREHTTSPRVRSWWRWALVVGVLQSIEYVFHTIAYLDAENLAAGASTPVLTTHLALAVTVYPIFGLVTAVFVWVGARRGVLGSAWAAPLGIAGLLCHALSAPLVLILGVEQARILFPLVMLFLLWMALVGLWPARQRVAVVTRG